MSSEIYHQARYYEIAFGFVNAGIAVDRFEAFIREHARTEVRTVLDICCGPSLELREFARRGYRAVGLDSSPQMLEYLKGKACAVETVQADMRDFRLDQPADFCFCMMGSIQYVGDNRGLLAHLSCVSDALRSGGLYLTENLPMHWDSPTLWTPETWEMSEDGITVRTTYRLEPVDAIEQTVRYSLEMDVDDNRQQMRLRDEEVQKLFFPQEFRSIVELHGAFEFVGFFERDSTERLRAMSRDNIVLLRKR